MSEDEFRALALSFPDTVEGFNMGSVFFKTSGMVLARLLPGDRAMLAGVPVEEVEMLTEVDPDCYWADAHHKNARCMVARLPQLDRAAARGFLERRFRQIAKKAVLRAWEAEKA